jgi:hypothetical protein
MNASLVSCKQSVHRLEDCQKMSENPEVQLALLQATINFQNHEIERIGYELARAIASKDIVERELGRVKNDLTNIERNSAIKEEQLRNARRKFPTILIQKEGKI